MTVHSPCLHNEFQSLLTRVIGQTPPPQPAMINLLLAEVECLLLETEKVHPWTRTMVVQSYPPKKRRMYEDVVKSLSQSPLHQTDAYINAFVKSERLENAETKDPRMIQARSPRFNVEFGRFTKPTERKLCTLTDGYIKPICKGLNQEQRAAKIVSFWDRLNNPVAVAADASRWDQHCGVPLLKVMHKLFLGMLHLSKKERRLAKYLFSQQLVTRGRTTNGLKYKHRGGVCSGDQTTGGGNCAMALLIMRVVRKALTGKIPELTGEVILKDRDLLFVDDGDDFVVFTEQKHLPVVVGMVKRLFLMAGHELTMEKPVTSLNQVQFCQTKPLYHHGRWEMMPDPRKALASSLSYAGHRQVEYLAVLWMMRALIHQGQPVLGPLFYRLHLLTRKKVPSAERVDRMLAVMGLGYQMRFLRRSRLQDLEIEPQSRSQVEEMWGLEIQEQFQLEELVIPIKGLLNPPTVSECVVHPIPVGVLAALGKNA